TPAYALFPYATLFRSTLHEPIQEYFKAANEKVLPKLRTGVPADREAAKALMKGSMNAIYERYTQAIDEAVRVSQERIANIEEQRSEEHTSELQSPCNL